MTQEEMYKELEFIREELFKIASLMANKEIANAMFKIGNLYSEVRNTAVEIKPKNNHYAGQLPDNPTSLKSTHYPEG